MQKHLEIPDRRTPYPHSRFPIPGSISPRLIRRTEIEGVLLGLEEEDGTVAEVEVYEVLRLMSDK